ncbi:MIZ zinc finger domain protein [Paecilomyces variotii No. 5]|uniref:MIZ zinc finger domain protein n=1 Tax=Byssochlamys spectabilis (strain No. 5 / NBRC 109023) TaxID=1356009 RepID=V5FUN3_BYSSN|nr:MIZ zinc finger domain protein [Paecilomyces variotii No. 5]
MSPRAQQNGQTSNRAAGWAFETSNSTLNKFLGGTRRAWMSGAAVHHSPSAPTRTQANSQSRPLVAPGQISSPASAAPTNIQLPSNGPPAPQTVTTDTAPISPITPVQKHSNIPVSIKQSPPPESELPEHGLSSAARDVGQISVLPSPEPSNGSRTSPAVLVDAEKGGNREADLNVLQSRLGQVESASATNGSQAGNTESLTATCRAGLAASGSVKPQNTAGGSTDQTLHRDKRPRIEVSHPTHSPTTLMPVVHEANRADSAGSASPSSDDFFWDCCLHALSQLGSASLTFSLSETVEMPRVRLLQEACRSEDLFYITLHQVFCLHTFAPSEFAKLTGFSNSQESGFGVIQRLLLDNRRLSGDFLRWCVNFPFSMSHMLQNAKYRDTLQQIGHSLSLLSAHWAFFEQETRRRSYPPLIDELVVRFHIISSTLQGVIFTAICRRHIKARDDNCFQRFLSLFERNRQNYLRRFADPRSTMEQMQRENEELVRGYMSLWKQSGPRNELQPQPSPSPVATQRAGQMASVPASTGSVHATPLARNSVRPSVQSPSIPILLSQPYSHSPPSRNTLQSHVLPPHSGQNVQEGPAQQILSNLVSPVQMPRRQHGAQSLSPTYFQQHCAISQAQPQNSRTYSYMPPMYSVPSQQMPSQMAQVPQVTQAQAQAGAPRRRGRPPLNVQTSAQPAPVVSGASVASPMHNRFIPYLPARMAQQQPAPPPHSPRRGPVSQYLLPAPGAIPPPRAHPSPVYASIHQLHLRDPARKQVRQGPEGEVEEELFQYLHSFAVIPTCLGQTETIFGFTFNVSNDALCKLPRDNMFPDGRRATRVLSNENRLYRLRCIKAPTSSQSVSEDAWVAAESVWPSVFYLHVNGKEMFVRRKTHHAKDLPLDITPNLGEGSNEITLHFLRSQEERDSLLYALAVEVLEIADLKRVQSLVRPLAASDSRLQIQQRLSVSATDEELSVVNDYITIGLIDPFMAQIFDVPARGRSCKHQECFDLDAYFSTRASKSGNGPMKENWKCPICREDCRPQNLVIDEFLVEVRAELQRSGKLKEARAIHVKADGTWQPKVEQDLPKEESRAPAKRKLSEMESQTPPLQAQSQSAGGTPQVAKAPEIIELD